VTPSRRLNDWIEGHVKYTENSESPKAYHVWAGISTIAAALQRRVWMKWGYSEIYPNQYIVIIGPSGNRKAEPIVIAREYAAHLGIPLVSEAITRQALYKRMKESISNYKRPDTGAISFHCSMFGAFEEMAVFLGDGDTQFLAALTNWYDSREQWTYETKNMGTDKIQGVCFNALGSMAPDWITACLPHTAIGGGFTSRIIFVVEHHKGKTVADPNEHKIDSKLKGNLLIDLERIFSLVGEMKFDKKALEAYKAWYQDDEYKAANGVVPIQDPRFGGYNSRRATHVKKISMAISASRSDNLVITESDFQRALNLMLQAEVMMADVFGKVGTSVYAEQSVIVMDFIKARGEVKKSTLLRALFRDIDNRALLEIESMLQTTGIITVTRNQMERDCLYRWVG
jgi:hypothetical protein